MHNAFANSAPPPRTHVGRYEILTKLAAGGMAEVYAARVSGTLGFSRLVALKLLYPHLVHEEQFLTMFLDEARLAARIHHPNVAATLDVGDAAGGVPYLVMEYIEGDHLGQLLNQAGLLGQRLPAPIVLRILLDALNGLAAAHALCDEHGKLLHLVHRDISPHNIMVGCDGSARITDFGVAKAEDRLTNTRAGVVKGKLSYMAPEQASTGQTDSRSDLFSMGVVLWESLTGTRLFRGENAAETLKLLLHAPIPAPSSVDPALWPLDDLLASALARDPEQRFQTADAFASELERVARTVGGLSPRRSVGAAVERLMQEKLERERALIASASNGQVQIADSDAIATMGSGPRALEASVDPLQAASAVTRPEVASSHSSSASSLRPQVRSESSSSKLASPLPVPPPPLGSLVQASRTSSPWSTFSLAARAMVLLAGLLTFLAMMWLTARGSQQVRTVRFSAEKQAPSAASQPLASAAKPEETAVQVPAVVPSPEAPRSDDPPAASTEDSAPVANDPAGSPVRDNTPGPARPRSADFALYDNPYLHNAPKDPAAPTTPAAPVEQVAPAGQPAPQLPAASEAIVPPP